MLREMPCGICHNITLVYHTAFYSGDRSLVNNLGRVNSICVQTSTDKNSDATLYFTKYHEKSVMFLNHLSRDFTADCPPFAKISISRAAAMPLTSRAFPDKF